MFVIACVGELEEEREHGETEAVLRRQVSVLEPHENLVVAYEPVWAIGTGKTATPEMAQEAHAFVKSILDVPVLYGGSVKPENAEELLAQPDVDGALVGGASLEVESFAEHLRGSISRPLVALVILDGWGCAPPGPGNAIELASTPVFDRLWATCPHTALAASGEAVGLPAGTDGELGGRTPDDRRGTPPRPGPHPDHQGDRGRLVLRERCLSGAAFERGENVHLLGLVSYGGVHSHIDHLRALLRFAPEKTWIHAFTDGRDVSPHAAVKDLAELPAERIATVCGRYYAMDRDERWERTQRAFDAIVDGDAADATDPVAAVQASYDRGVTDEFIEPVVLEGRPRLGPRTAAIFFNFRPDRARQLSRKLVDAGFDLTTMTRYDDDLDCPVAFGEQDSRGDSRRDARRRRYPPAARGRDREVRPRDVLPERRPGRAVAGGGADADPVPAGRRRRTTRSRRCRRPRSRAVRGGRRDGRSTASRS